jgi:hypothetical protein
MQVRYQTAPTAPKGNDASTGDHSRDGAILDFRIHQYALAGEHFVAGTVTDE